MEINRRRLMAGSAASLVLATTPLCAKTASSLYASARSNKKGEHFAVIFSPDEGDIARVKLSTRAHEITSHPHKTTCVAVGRRPGRSCTVFGLAQKPFSFHSKEHRHFLGHGVYSADGQLFYTSENDYEGERGVIGVRDVLQQYKQIGEFPSHGVGPHQIALAENGKTLVIANGGILTHPDMGRQKLNLDVMQPSLVYLDAKTGTLLEKHSLPSPLHQLSIRHFAITANGTIVLGMQYNGKRSQHRALIGFQQRGQHIQLAKAPINIQKNMRNYVGSVAIDQSGTIAAASCPRGNMITFWNIKQRRFLKHSVYSIKDGCGIAANQNTGGFMLTSGLGEVGHYALHDKIFVAAKSHQLNNLRWDNHLSRLR